MPCKKDSRSSRSSWGLHPETQVLADAPLAVPAVMLRLFIPDPGGLNVQVLVEDKAKNKNHMDVDDDAGFRQPGKPSQTKKPWNYVSAQVPHSESLAPTDTPLAVPTVLLHFVIPHLRDVGDDARVAQPIQARPLGSRHSPSRSDPRSRQPGSLSQA